MNVAIGILTGVALGWMGLRFNEQPTSEGAQSFFAYFRLQFSAAGATRAVLRRIGVCILWKSAPCLKQETVQPYQPEVILMDINLPGISGIEAMRILGRDPSTAHIPIIALSANALPHDIEMGLKAGFFDYLTKPIKVNQFMDALDAALKISQAASDLEPKMKKT